MHWPRGNLVRLLDRLRADPRTFYGDFNHVPGDPFGVLRRSIRGVSEIAVVKDDESWRHEYDEQPAPPTLAVLVYSDDRTVRQQVRLALGKRPARDLPALEYTEVATPAALIQTVDKGSFDLLILDGEAVPAGGMGLCRQLKDEIYRCPPILVIIGRPQDAWLATWSRADGVIGHPIDAIATATTVADLLRTRVDA